MTILEETKSYLGVHQDETEFDGEILTHINMAIFKLYSLGAPYTGVCPVISNVTQYDDLTDYKPNVISVLRNYVNYSTKNIFDPSPNSKAVEATSRELDRMEQFIYMICNSDTEGV